MLGFIINMVKSFLVNDSTHSEVQDDQILFRMQLTAADLQTRFQSVAIAGVITQYTIMQISKRAKDLSSQIDQLLFSKSSQLTKNNREKLRILQCQLESITKEMDSNTKFSEKLYLAIGENIRILRKWCASEENTLDKILDFSV